MVTSVATSEAAAPRENVMSVYRRIRRMILSGEVKSGQPLSQVQLATDFEISRGPVREALRMLQREGLIEAETNQRGRVATFSPAEMEQVCAMLVINVAAAISVSDGLISEKDIERIRYRIDLIERLADKEDDSMAPSSRRIYRRQLAFRRLVTLLCQYSGPQVVQTIDGLLDRIALFRQMAQAEGETPPYPLASRFPELRDASQACDAPAMARIMVERIAEVSRKALLYVEPRHQPNLLDAYVDMALGMLKDNAGGSEQDGAGFAELTIKLRGRPNSKIEYVVTHD